MLVSLQFFSPRLSFGIIDYRKPKTDVFEVTRGAVIVNAFAVAETSSRPSS